MGETACPHTDERKTEIVSKREQLKANKAAGTSAASTSTEMIMAPRNDDFGIWGML